MKYRNQTCYQRHTITKTPLKWLTALLSTLSPILTIWERTQCKAQCKSSIKMKCKRQTKLSTKKEIPKLRQTLETAPILHKFTAILHHKLIQNLRIKICTLSPWALSMALLQWLIIRFKSTLLTPKTHLTNQLAITKKIILIHKVTFHMILLIIKRLNNNSKQSKLWWIIMFHIILHPIFFKRKIPTCLSSSKPIQPTFSALSMNKAN